jgi:hypothetical protein
MFVIPGIGDNPTTLFWITRDALHSASLVAVPVAVTPSPGPSGSVQPSGKPGKSPVPSRRP